MRIQVGVILRRAYVSCLPVTPSARHPVMTSFLGVTGFVISMLLLRFCY